MCKVQVVLLLVSCAVFLQISSAEITEEAKLATNQFTLDLLKATVLGGTGNVVVSPVGVYICLAMLQQGAAGDTRQQINNAVHTQPGVTKTAYKQLATRYSSSFSQANMKFATRMFVNSSIDVKSGYNQVLVNDFKSDIEHIAFNDGVNARNQINTWVYDHTNEHVSQMLETSDISTTTLLTLVNALYVHNSWDEEFTDLQDKRFIGGNGNELNVPTLSQTRVYYAGESTEIGAKFVHIDLEDTAEFTILLLLPNARSGLDSMLNSITARRLTNIFKESGQRNVTLQFPKFRFATGVDLKPILQGLGIHKAFENDASFPEISDEHLQLHNVFQKSEIAADQNGVTGAAGTVNLLFTHSNNPRPGTFATVDNMEFKADHPFLVFLVDRTNHIPVLAGRVSDPNAPSS